MRQHTHTHSQSSVHNGSNDPSSTTTIHTNPSSLIENTNQSPSIDKSTIEDAVYSDPYESQSDSDESTNHIHSSHPCNTNHPTLATPIPSRSSRKKGGRPMGSTNERKRRRIERIKQAKNDICKNFVRITEHDNLTKITKKGLFDFLVKEQQMYGNLPAGFNFSYETMRSRIRRHNFDGNGNESPMRQIEQQIVEIIICMSKIKRSITPFEGLALINDLIDGTEVQR